ncbi:MAG TPA: LPS export ABC transporter permease LptG [Nitrospiria bacterium]|nr:LPS export ABC transporter permease LptG [Nitrospiria bacterium]
MSLLHRHISKEFLRIWGLTFGALLLVSQIIEIFTRLRRYADRSMPFDDFTAFLLLHLPQTLLILIPITTLIAAIVALGLMSKRRELLAMRTVGLSPHYIAAPILLFGVVISGSLMAANWSLIPAATRQSEWIKNVKLLGRQESVLFGQNRLWLQLDRDRLMNIQLVHPVLDVLYGVTLYRMDESFDLVELIEAGSIEFKNGRWFIVQGTRWRFQADRSVAIESLQQTPIDLGKEPADFRSVVVDPDELDNTQLWHYIEQLRRSGLDSARYEINYYAKLAIPAVTLLMVMIGVPLGMRGGRWPQLAQGISLAILISIAYALVQAYTMALGNRAILHPVIAAWFADGLLVMVGSGLLWRLR